MKMKKFLLLISLFVSATVLFAQTITLSFNDTDVTSLNAGDEILVSITVEDIQPVGVQISGFQLSINVDPMYMEWNGTTTNPVPGINYVHPNFAFNPSDWIMNNTLGVMPGELLAQWLFPGFFGGADITSGEVLMILSYEYLGGMPAGATAPIWLNFAKSSNPLTPDGMMMKGKFVTEIYDGDVNYFTITVDEGSIYTQGGPTATMWTGLGDGVSWFDPMNWNPQVVPTIEDVIIEASKAPTVLISGGYATTGALSVAAGAGIEIATDGGLTTNGLYTNDGTLVLLTDGSGNTGSFIDNGGVAGTGTFLLDRWAICSGTAPGVADPFGWHYISSPVNGFTSDMLYDYFVNAWDQPTGMWMQFSMDPILFPCTPWPTTVMGDMEAWSINFDLTYPDPNCPLLPAGTGSNIEFMGFMGDVHSGAYNAALGYGATGYEMWNLVGNPYPSGLDLSTVTFGPNTVAGAAFYDGCVGNYVYAGLTADWVVAPSLGFFVETTGADNLAVDNSNRVHPTDWWWKSDNSDVLILEATGNETSDKLMVRFAEEATAGFDNVGDFHKLIASTEGLPQIYTVAGQHNLAINALPSTSLVPMAFEAITSGTYTISAVETSEFANVVLEDKVLGIQTDLLSGNYSFEYTAGEDANRFIIHFTPLGVNESSAIATDIWAADQTIYVQTTATKGTISVYNMMGQEVVSTDIQTGINEIPMKEVNTYYVVKVIGSEFAETGKVYIK